MHSQWKLKKISGVIHLIGISASITHHQKSFFLQYMGTNTESPKWTKCKIVRDFGTLSLKCDIFINPHPSELRSLHRKGGRNVVRARGEVGIQGNSLPETTGLIHMWIELRDCGIIQRQTSTVKHWKNSWNPGEGKGTGLDMWSRLVSNIFIYMFKLKLYGIPALTWKSKHGFQPLTKNLSAIDTHWQRKN